MTTHVLENQHSSNLVYASISRRLLAFFIDGLILCLPMAFASSVIPVLGGLIVWFFYAPVLESSAARATLGKHLAGIQVSDLSGRQISFRAAMIRNALKLVSFVLLLIGFIVALFTEKKQAIHDLLADTLVVYGRDERPIVDSWTASAREIFRSDSTSSASSTAPYGETSASTSAPLFRDADSIASQLERLQSLKEKGTLSEDEFQAAKKKILT